MLIMMTNTKTGQSRRLTLPTSEEKIMDTQADIMSKTQPFDAMCPQQMTYVNAQGEVIENIFELNEICRVEMR